MGATEITDWEELAAELNDLSDMARVAAQRIEYGSDDADRQEVADEIAEDLSGPHWPDDIIEAAHRLADAT